MQDSHQCTESSWVILILDKQSTVIPNFFGRAANLRNNVQGHLAKIIFKMHNDRQTTYLQEHDNKPFFEFLNFAGTKKRCSALPG